MMNWEDHLRQKWTKRRIELKRAENNASSQGDYGKALCLKAAFDECGCCLRDLILKNGDSKNDGLLT